MTDPSARLNAALEGRYKIERELGEGGMATVYLAEDLRHERKVALKVLKPELAAVVGAERFLAEIKTTANLQHPHILPLHDSGEADGFLYFVMPYIEGDTLRDRIDREKQLPIDDALEITKKVASALDYAHEHGVVHRDIKPGNILLSERGEPTVADFGIALAVAQAGGGRVTETGLSVGTPHYMSPEQATGDRDVDTRADVYALGCVLYEMLTGEPPYSGVSAQAVLAKILTDPPPAPTKVRMSVPPNVDAAIRKALEKLPADRFGTAQEFAKALGDRSFRYGEAELVEVPTSRGQWTALTTGASVVAVLSTLGFGWLLLRPEPPDPVSRLVISAAPSEPVQTTVNYEDVAISPDGQSLVYQTNATAAAGAVSVRSLDRLESLTLQGPEFAFGPFISPDGAWIGFQAGIGGPLQRVSILGGPPQTVASLPADLRGASWGPDDTIVFGVNAPGGLWQVPAAGGEPVPLTEADNVAHTQPEVLPGGNGVLFVVNTQPGTVADNQIALLDLRSGEHRVIIPSGTSPRYASSGHIVYAVAGGTLMAVAFDLERLEVTSDPVPMVENIVVKGSGAASFGLSDTGSLVYVSGSGTGGVQRTAVWVDREGREQPLPLPPRRYQDPRLSPDGTRLAIGVLDSEGTQPLWVFDVVSAAGLRLTQAGTTRTPVWTTDGRIAFAANLEGPFQMFMVAADGSGSPEVLIPNAGGYVGDFPTGITPDGRTLIFTRQVVTNQHVEIFQVSLEGDPVPEPLLQGEFVRGNAGVSPNGQWLLYRSNQSGQMEVYVQPYPGPGPTIPVSLGGGYSVTWSPDGSELIYRLDDRMMAVSFDVEGGTPRIGRPTELFRGDYVSDGPAGARQYHIAPDGRFLMLRDVTGPETGDELPPQVVLVQNFFEELRQVVPDN